MAYGQNMNAPMAGTTGLAALKGRQGDNTLVHVNPMELKALDNMAPGGLTRNPYTGLPEAFKLKDILPALGAVAATVLTGGTALPAFAAAGLGGAAGAAAAGYNREEILGAGVGSALTAGIMGPTGFGGKEAATQLATEAAETGVVQTGLAGVPGAESVGRGLLTEGGKELAAGTARELGAQTLGMAGYGAAGAMLPAVLAAPEVKEEPTGPIQSIKTENVYQGQSKEDIDKFIRQGGTTPQFFKQTVLQPGIYRQEGGSMSSPEGRMFSGMVEGKGDGMSDEVAFDVVGDPQIDTAMLSPDEYVMDAYTVAALGNGSSDAGAEKLDAFRTALREKVYGKQSQPNEIDGAKELNRLA